MTYNYWGRSLYWGRDGKPMTQDDVGRLLGDSDYCQIATDYIGPDWISTIWGGVDHNLLGSGPPVIFETMVFATDPDSEPGTEMETLRYSTEAAALTGHQEMVTLIRATHDLSGPIGEGDAG